MKEMIKRVREEKGGFTLAELLIVVAILLVLIAIAVPLFTGALDKAQNAVAIANARSAQSEALTNYKLAESTAQKTLTTQYFYYDDHGNEIHATGSGDPAAGTFKYKYTVILTDTNGDVSVRVDMNMPEQKNNILSTATTSTGGEGGGTEGTD